MPSKQRAPSESAAVDLTDFTIEEIGALGLACLMLDVPEPYPDEGFAALSRIDSARRAGRDNARNVPRKSLMALADFLRPHQAEAAAIPQLDHFLAAFAKLEKRLQARPGRPFVTAETWRERAQAVKAAARAFKHANGYATDAQVEAVLGLSAGTLRRWRFVHRDLFTDSNR